MHASEDLGQLIALGATWQWDDPGGRWTVLADPEGNLFCAIPQPRERRVQGSVRAGSFRPLRTPRYGRLAIAQR